MAESDALSQFDFSKVTKGGLFLKWEAGKPVVLRVLTTDPIVSTQEFESKQTGEVSVSTRFAFIVYNFTDNKAQILQASPAMARKIGELHVDPEFGANIKSIDIRISPTGEGLERRYDTQVLPKARDLTNAMIKEAKAIDLDEKVEGDRMSLYDPDKKSGYDQAKEARANLTSAGLTDDSEEEELLGIDDIPF